MPSGFGICPSQAQVDFADSDDAKRDVRFRYLDLANSAPDSGDLLATADWLESWQSLCQSNQFDKGCPERCMLRALVLHLQKSQRPETTEKEHKV